MWARPTTSLLSDGELDELAGLFVDAAVLASQAGFDFVDIKHCHGYLLHELLTGYDRPGRYGGDLAGRTLFLRTVVEGIRAACTRAWRSACASRCSTSSPSRRARTAAATPAADAPYRYAFGGDGTGRGIDLTETHELLASLEPLGIGLVGTTAGSPYYCPHVQRPAYFPPSDGYAPPEDPLVGVARQLAATAEVTRRHPRLTVVGAGYTYLQDWLPQVAQAVVAAGGAHMIGLGRMLLSYPDLAGRRARRPAARAPAGLPDLQRLHHGAAQRTRLRLLPAGRLLQGAPRPRRPREGEGGAARRTELTPRLRRAR